MQPVEIGPVPAQERTQTPLDIFLIFAAANIVATTLQVGASLASSFSFRVGLTMIVVGVIAGSGIVASVSPIGPRLGVPSIIATRAVLGIRGAAIVAVFLYLMNFAWIALNNVIAASAATRVAGGEGRYWSIGLGLAATAVVAAGPRAVAIAARFSVPLLILVGLVFTIALTRVPVSPPVTAATGGDRWFSALDVVIAYQVSWILMFADYTRYTRSERGSAIAVFSGLALTSLWFMPLGLGAARVAGSHDPGTMTAALGLGIFGPLLHAVATVTTNFVNIYLSALALKSLFPRVGQQFSIWSIGIIGTVLGAFSGQWLDRYADFMVLLGASLVPVGSLLFAHFFLLKVPVRTEDLYDPEGPYGGRLGISFPAILAWGSGTAIYFMAGNIGGTLPAIVTTIAVYATARSVGKMIR
ncbi:MAG: cytosine permease [Thermoanaerobaculia bacterium]|nr:cytosine permease [Thermoanaerobaculia bacterium]